MSPLRRTPLKRGKPVNRVNRARRASEFARCYGSVERVEWVKREPSAASDKRPCVNAHIRNGGAGRKADYRYIVPLTDEEHIELHAYGKTWFEDRYGIDLEKAAAETERLWLEQQDTEECA